MGWLRVRTALAAFLLGAFVPTAVWAQATGASGIAGTVKDASGGLMPGVLVEATSPALIEKSRIATTNGQGQYNLVDLRPGLYTVTFTLVGFSTLKQEGIELPSNFTATVNAELKVGALEETVLVTGQSPVVDVQNVVTATRLSRDTLDQVPVYRTNTTMIALMPSSIGASNTQDVGGSKGEFGNRFAVHGSRSSDQRFMQDGMRWNGSTGAGDNANSYVNPASVQEIVIEAGAGGSAETAFGGVSLNVIPRDGGNKFATYLFANYTDDWLESDNLRTNVRDRGLTSINKTTLIFDVSGGLGGPIMKDKLWFYTAHRYAGNNALFANYYYNKSPNPVAFVPDLSRPGFAKERNRTNQVRLTWQASQRNKFSVSVNNQRNCNCPNNEQQNLAPEAVQTVNRWPTLYQGTWNNVVSRSLLLEAGVSTNRAIWRYGLPSGSTEDSISVNDTGLGIRYGAPASVGLNPVPNLNMRGSLSYVTGSHQFKTGIQWAWGKTQSVTQRSTTDVSYTFVNGRPSSITEYANPLNTDRRNKPDMALYVQDRWTVKRLTISPGLRWDHFHGYVPASTQPGNRFLAERRFDQVDCVPCWNDLNPRLALAYDLFGTGKTAVSGSVGRYVQGEVTTTAGQNDPAVTNVNNVTRTWNDTNFNLIPDCDLTNPEENGECRAISNRNFGLPNISTFYDPDLLTGWHKRPYSWRTSLEFKHEVLPGVGVTAGYYRTWYGNFRVTDDRSIGPEDFDPFCVQGPTDSRLPNGGGALLCGFYNLKQSKFGTPANNYVTFADHFGKQTEIYNGADFLMQARLPRGGILQGGVNIGNAVLTQFAANSTSGVSSTNRCFVVDSPQELRNCKVPVPYKARLKLVGAYNLPWNLQAGANLQSLPGTSIDANWAAPSTAVIGLGRPLAGGASTVAVPLLDPYTKWEARLLQLDLRLAKTFNVGTARLQGQFDVYNVTNANSMLLLNNTFGANWLVPSEILNARLFKFGLQMSF